jgi:hypothetical protein
MTLGVSTLSMMTLRTITVKIMALRIMGLIEILSINNIQYNVWCSRCKDQSAARFCHQVAAWMFGIFHLVKSHKIANNSATTEAREKNRHRFGILRIIEIFLCMFDSILKLSNFN